jgi:stage II sporulation SpoAA-like protein
VIEQIENAPTGVIAFRAVGKVEAADYESVLRPAIEAAVADGGKIRIVFELGPDFDGYSIGAAWEDMKLWGPHLTKWERCAVVTDHRLIADAIRVFKVVMPGEVKVFPATGLDDALRWAAASD